MASQQVTRKTWRVSEGVLGIHQTRCRANSGGRCNCDPSYRMEPTHPLTKKRDQLGTTRNLDEAQARVTDYLNRARSGTAGVVTAKLTVRAAWEEFYEAARTGVAQAKGGVDYKPSVLSAYNGKMDNYILPKIGDRLLTAIYTHDVQKLVDELKPKLAAKTINNTVIPLKVLYTWSKRRGYAIVNPCDDVETLAGEEEVREIVSVPKALDMLRALVDAKLSAWEIALWATAFFSGLRRGELMGLDWSNVDLVERRVKVARAFDPYFKARDQGVVKSNKILGFPA